MESTLAVQQVSCANIFTTEKSEKLGRCQNSPFFQFIQQLMRDSPNDVDTLLKAPEHQDEGVWKYEHIRQFCMDLNLITVKLQDECSPETCSQMTATEQWIFLCAAHKNPKEASLVLRNALAQRLEILLVYR